MMSTKWCDGLDELEVADRAGLDVFGGGAQQAKLDHLLVPS